MNLGSFGDLLGGIFKIGDHVFNSMEEANAYLQSLKDKAAAELAQKQKDAANKLKSEAGKAEDSINDTISDTMDTAEGNLGGLLEDNNDTLLDMGDTIDSNIADLGEANENLGEVMNDIGALTNEGLDALAGVGNPNSLINNPVGWYEEAAGVGKGGWSLDWLDEQAESQLEGQLGGALGAVLSGKDDPWNQPDYGDEGGGEGTGTGGGIGTYRGRNAIAGDPFASSSETRRLIQEQDTFQSRLKKDKNIAPSLINASSYA